jgi:hypothetical protein
LGSMPTYHVSKGPFGILDAQFGSAGNFMTAYNKVLNPPGGAADPALGSGNAAMTLQQRATKKVAANELTSGQAAHFVNHWLGTWWPNLSVADTLRLGIQQAIQYAKAANGGQGLPMEFFWVCVREPLFQVYYSKGQQQVTVLVLTPSPPPNYQADPFTNPEELWVVKRWDVFDDQYPAVNGTPAGLVSDPVTLGFTTSPPPGTIIKQQIWHT